MQRPVLPLVHVTRLATLHNELCIQYISARELARAIDYSSDLRHDLGDTVERDFIDLLNRKLARCTSWFLDNLATEGILEPVVIIVLDDGSWWLDEGHHRLAWGYMLGIDVPVIFDDSGADENTSVLSGDVLLPGLRVTHGMTAQDFLEAALATCDEVLQDEGEPTADRKGGTYDHNDYEHAGASPSAAT